MRQSPLRNRKADPKGTKAINMRVDSDLHDTLMHLSIELNITATEIVSQYLKYLKKNKRKLLNEHSKPEFTLAVDDEL